MSGSWRLSLPCPCPCPPAPAPLPLPLPRNQESRNRQNGSRTGLLPVKTETVHAAWCLPGVCPAKQSTVQGQNTSTWVLAKEPFILSLGAKAQLLLNEILIRGFLLQAIASVCHWPFGLPSSLSLHFAHVWSIEISKCEGTSCFPLSSF